MSTNEVCPTCEGECCVNKHGSTAEHGSVLALHSCPDCKDGTVTKPARTAEDERADVLAYIAYASAFPFTYDKGTPAILNALRELIEQGQHEGLAKKEKA